MLLEKDVRNLAIEYLKSYIGKFYKWGGDDPSGFDCSGLVIEVLKAVGVLQRNGDWRAADLFNMFGEIDPMDIMPGDLVFWHGARIASIIHVEMIINDKISIGASGGGSNTLTEADAIRQNAFIKPRPIQSRSGVAGYRNPFKKPFYPIYV
jgi:cell wall-associated NlpC family hydrolase